ncbi:hypothetical protein BT69DRAFT_1261387 [Atractiella rhizophila]|nr:hypothetical protein BT69DRAFT_1261387 [Atractiella rhizophila]
MGAFFDDIPEHLIEWIKKQHVFQVATAPLKGGHVNVSPKGGECFHIVNNKQVYYLDCTGSGNETISHLYEPGNGRLTIMFAAFEGAPRIVRLYGKGSVFERGTPEFERYYPAGETLVPGARSVILLDITKVGSSCGYSVPFFEFVKHRNTLNNYFEKVENPPQEKGDVKEIERNAQGIPVNLVEYWRKKNADSIDGLPGLKIVSKQNVWSKISKTARGDLISVLFLGLLLGIVVGFIAAQQLPLRSSVSSVVY